MSTSNKAPKTVAAMPKVLAVADLNKAIDSVNAAASAIMNTYQEVGVQTLMHLKAHGDIGPVNRLMVGMPKGARRQAMGSWLLAYGALSINLNRDTAKLAPLSFDKTKKTDPEAALADAWFTHLPEKELSDIFDLQKAIHGLLVRAKGKTLVLHGKTMSVDHAVDTLKTLAAMAGETIEPDVKQLPNGTEAPKGAEVPKVDAAPVVAAVNKATRKRESAKDTAKA